MSHDNHQNSFYRQPVPFERINYYFGKMMTVRDFTDEQRYLNEKRWMLNRYGIGWGVLCGLKVKPHPQERNKVLVEPGFAIDSYGNEIKVCQEQEVDINTAKDEYRRKKREHPETTQEAATEPEESPDEDNFFYYVSLKYHECDVEPSPVPVEDCGELQTECFYNRTRETFQLKVTRGAPPIEPVLNSEQKEKLKCITECSRFLENPAPVITAQCFPRDKCSLIPLARVCFNTNEETIPLVIDNNYRKLAYSNEYLYQLIRCLQQTHHHQNSSQQDRRRFVPLLAHTINGVQYQNGKIVEMAEQAGKQPQRLTSDGDYIWFTDMGDDEKIIRRINRYADQVTIIEDEKLNLPEKPWGIAFDGQSMWITHPEAAKLTRINVCTLEKWTLAELPNSLENCQIFSPDSVSVETVPLKPNPKEIVYHHGYIYVAHTEKNEEDIFTHNLSQIDPKRGYLVREITIADEGGSEYKINSEILSLVSDGDDLWIAYQGKKGERKRVIVQKITTPVDSEPTVEPAIDLNDGQTPQRMVFDGTHLWVSHNDGVSQVNILTLSNYCSMVGSQSGAERAQTALTYTGGEYLWSAEIGRREARVNRINIYTGNFAGGLEIQEFQDRSNVEFEITDMQFDGNHIYLTAYFQEGDQKTGRIHRLLP